MVLLIVYFLYQRKVPMDIIIKPFKLVLALVVMASSLGPATIAGVADISQEFGKTHQLLEHLAAEAPEQMVAVIVQKVTQDSDLDALVAQMGGKVTQDLHIINAFAAEMPAQSVLALSQEPGVRWISPDGMVERSGKRISTPGDDLIEPLPENYYLDTTGARSVWDMGLTGQGITVAVIDSGIFIDPDFSRLDKRNKIRVVWEESFSANSFKTDDATGHGTHVAGIIGGNGLASDGAYRGVAPQVNLVNLKVSDESGVAYESDVVAALQWVYDNKDAFNVRVVNISLNSTVEQSYHASPMNAAVEILWFNGVVVVASAGNNDSSFNTASAAPANDPFIITVGASDEHGTSDNQDDSIATFSAFGATQDGYTKPDIVAPGKNIVSVLAWSSDWRLDFPDRVIMDGEYFRLSGTSMAAPIVTGAIALLLQDEPDLTPDQVKYRLLQSSDSISDDYGNSYPYLDAYAAVTGDTTGSANTGNLASQLLWSGEEAVAWESVAWNSVAWNSVAWNSVAWKSVAWNSVAWNSVAWNE